MTRHYAGFNRLSQRVPIGGNELVTSCLAGCIAVVAYNRAQNQMAMAHYDTAQCSGANGTQALVNFREWLKLRTGANAFCVGFGFGARNTADDLDGAGYSLRDEMRYRLAIRVKEAFHEEPLIAAHTARFYIDGPQRVMEGSMSEEWVAGARWENEGFEIPYLMLAAD